MPPKKGKAEPKQKAKPEKERKNKKANDSDDDEKPQKSNIPVWLQSDLESKNLDVVIEPVNMNTPDGVPLLSNTQVKLVQGHRYGLIGRNGIGKTTLMRLIASKEMKGFPKAIEVLHVEQEAPNSKLGVLEFAMSQDIKTKRLVELEAKIEQDMEDGIDTADTLTLLGLVQEKKDELDVHNAESRAKAILLGLGFSTDSLTTPVCELSGGWRMRVALGTALFVSPDILLLDEPTNHLDFPAIIWLENYMKSYTKTCVIVSHDRQFLNSVCTDVIDFRDLKLTYYRGDYNGYLKTRGDNLREQQRRYEAVQRQVGHLKAMIERFKTSQSESAQVSNKMKELKKLEAEDAKPVIEEKKWGFKFPEPEKLKAEQALLRLLEVTFNYPDKPTILKDVNLHVDLNSRIGVMGVNGVGKSTLIKLIKGDFLPTKGKVSLNDYARWASFDQHHAERLDHNQSPFQYMQQLFPDMKDQEVRNHLGSLGLGGNLALQKIGGLSGGQKSRLAFSIVVYRQPHLLIMDEPTNHLDLETVEALIEAVKEFKGGVLVVSHDVYFLTSIVTEYWALDGSGKVMDLFEFDEAKEFAYKLSSPKKPQSMHKKKNKKNQDDDDDDDRKKPSSLPVVNDEDDDEDGYVNKSSYRSSATALSRKDNVKRSAGAGSGGAPNKNVGSAFALLSLEDEEPDQPDEPEEPEPEPEPEPEAEAEAAVVKKKKKKKDKETAAADGSEEVTEKKKKKKDKSSAADAAVEDTAGGDATPGAGEEVTEKKKKKKKDKVDDASPAADEPPTTEATEKKKKKKKDPAAGDETAEAGGEEPGSETTEKKKKKKKEKTEDGTPVAEESTGAEEGEKKKKKKKEKTEDAEANPDAEATDKPKKKKKEKTADETGDATPEASGEVTEKKKKKKEKTEETADSVDPEAGEKKKKKKKEKEASEETGDDTGKKKKKPKDADDSTPVDGSEVPEEDKEKKKKKKKKEETESQDAPEEEAKEKKKKKKPKDGESAETTDVADDSEKKPKKKKEKGVSEVAETQDGENKKTETA